MPQAVAASAVLESQQTKARPLDFSPSPPRSDSPTWGFLPYTSARYANATRIDLDFLEAVAATPRLPGELRGPCETS